MSNPLLLSLVANYHWQLSLIAAAGIFAVIFIGKQLTLLVPAIRGASQLNRSAYLEKMKKPAYAANQKWNRKWGPLYLLVTFGLVVPFCLTIDPQQWWQVPLDIFVILMVYDFFYYLVHRFLFHDNGFLGGPLIHIHAVHHRQHNPCRMDSTYIHPLEVAMGLGLYVATIFVLSRFMGNFHVVTVIVTWVAFSQINQHNHDLWTADRFPFKYLNFAAQMHHNHHAKFTGGNFATISLFYDWLFGTLDYGKASKSVAMASRQPDPDARAVSPGAHP